MLVILAFCRQRQEEWWVWCPAMLYIKILSQLHQNTALLVGYYPGSDTKAWLENKGEWVSQWTLTYAPSIKRWSVAFRCMYFKTVLKWCVCVCWYTHIPQYLLREYIYCKETFILYSSLWYKSWKQLGVIHKLCETAKSSRKLIWDLKVL